MNVRKKVLLVDDDADFVRMHKAVLENNGYTVVTACNGEECLEKAHAEKPDLIVLDVMMANVSDGFNVSNVLRNSEHTKDIPILMVTSVAEKYPFRFEPDDVWLPVDAFLEKPVAPEILLQKVRAWLGEPSRSGEATHDTPQADDPHRG